MANFSSNVTDGSYSSLSEEEIRAYQDNQRHEQTNRDILLGAIKCVAPFGLLVNLSFLYVAVRIKSMHSIVNVYLANLAAVDTAFFTLSLVVLLSDAWELIPMESASFARLVASYCFVTALAFERFSAVRRPLTFRATASKSRAAKISAALWLISVAAGIGYGLATRIQNQIIPGVLQITIYLSIVSVNAFLYIRTVKKLCQKPNAAPRQHCRRVVTRVLFVLVLNTFVFFSASILLAVQDIFGIVIFESDISWLTYLKASDSLASMRVACFILICINSAINPLVYSCVNADYRAAFARAFFCHTLARRCGRNRDRPRPVEQIELRVIRHRQTPRVTIV